jgi:hypothetical protein
MHKLPCKITDLDADVFETGALRIDFILRVVSFINNNENYIAASIKPQS